MKMQEEKTAAGKASKYEKPEMKSFTADELLEWIGPARGIGNGGARTDPPAAGKSPNKFGF